MKFGTKYIAHSSDFYFSSSIFRCAGHSSRFFLCIHFLKEFANILQNESRREEAVKHRHPGLRLYVHVHCFSNMWQYRGGLDSLKHIPDWSHITSDKMHQTVLFLHLHSKPSSRASTALSSMGADTQGKPSVSLQPHDLDYVLHFGLYLMPQSSVSVQMLGRAHRAVDSVLIQIWWHLL